MSVAMCFCIRFGNKVIFAIAFECRSECALEQWYHYKAGVGDKSTSLERKMFLAVSGAYLFGSGQAKNVLEKLLSKNYANPLMPQNFFAFIEFQTLPGI